MSLAPDSKNRKRLSVLIDGYYVDSNRGMGRYIREVIDAVGEHLTAFDLHVLVPKGAQFRVHQDVITYHVQPRLPFPLWEQILVPIVTARLKPDIVHSPFNTFPLMHLWRPSQVVTVHDLMFMKRDFETMSARQDFGRLYRGLVVGLVPRGRVAVTTMTRTVADEIRQTLGREAMIHRTPVSHFVSGAREPVDGAPESFALHVGGAVPHKNSARAIRAFRKAGLKDSKLLVLGIRKDHALATEFSGPDVVFPGWLTDGQILTLYDAARAVIFPSLMEGYGLPSLEGLACDCVVVTSNRNPMMELAGDAALLADPLDEQALADAIIIAMTDEDRRAELIAKGRKRILQFGGQALAASLETIYRAHAHAKNG
jgi:glycosyltransferase involved in cell wall biosynthesis